MRSPSNALASLPRQPSLPHVIAERIEGAIASGELKPGARLVESRLAGELGVSRGPLREALKMLAGRGLVDIRDSRGTFVTQVGDDDLLAMVTLRAGLEGYAARFVASAFTPEREAELRALLVAGREAAESGRTAEWRDLDWRFHEAVVAAAGNPYLLSAWRDIGNLVRLFLHTHPVFVLEVGATLANHDALYAALRSGDPEMAEQAFRRVILLSAFRRFDRGLPSALAGLDRPEPSVARRRRPAVA